MNAKTVLEHLRRRYVPPEHALFTEVGNATGFGTTRHIDALAMGLWPSSGMLVEGIEIKVSRSDWLRERKQPAKAAEIACYCDRFWLCVSEAKIVRAGELPEGWGLLVVTDEPIGVRVHVPAAPLSPPPLSRSFIAAIARAAHKCAPAVEGAAARLKRARSLGVQEGRTAEASAARKRAEDTVQRELEWMQTSIRTLQAQITEMLPLYERGRDAHAAEVRGEARDVG